MRIEIVAIGDEVVSGSTVNRNGAFIARELYQIGLQVTGQRVVGDEVMALSAVLADLLEQNDLVICSGGLGPTLDDCTRKAVEALVGGGSRFDKSVAQNLRDRFGAEYPALEDQATVPSAARVFVNEVGTAPGLLFELPKCWLVLLPGVPMEMKSLLTQKILPVIKEHFPIEERVFQERLFMLLTTESCVDPVVRDLSDEFPDLRFGIYPSHAYLSVQIGVKARSERKAQERIAPARQRLEKQFGKLLFPDGVERLEEALYTVCTDKGVTVATAESCSGGAIAHRITSVPGSSNYFKGGAVTYSNALKHSLLGVSLTTLQRHGAVSREVVEEMARGAQERFDVDFAVAVSGIAGPSGGTEEKPVGTVWLSIAQRDGEIEALSLHLSGDREAVVLKSVNQALARLVQCIH